MKNQAHNSQLYFHYNHFSEPVLMSLLPFLTQGVSPAPINKPMRGSMSPQACKDGGAAGDPILPVTPILDRPCPQCFSIIAPHLAARPVCCSPCNGSCSGGDEGGRRGRSLPFVSLLCLKLVLVCSHLPASPACDV